MTKLQNLLTKKQQLVNILEHKSKLLAISPDKLNLLKYVSYLTLKLNKVEEDITQLDSK